LKIQHSTESTPYIFRFLLFLCFLHTVEVTGSNPVSPTIFFSITCVISEVTKSSGETKTVPKFDLGNAEDVSSREYPGDEHSYHFKSDKDLKTILEKDS